MSLSTIFSKYIQLSFHVGFALISLVQLFSMKISLKTANNYENFELLISLFLSCVLGYNFTKGILQLKKNTPTEKLFHISLFIILLLGLFKLPIRTLFVFVINLIGTIGYIIPNKNGKNWREQGALKSFIVAICWANAIVLTQWIHYTIHFTELFIYQYSAIILLIIALIIPFDIRDMEHDPYYLQTIPKILGVQKSKILCMILLTGFCFCALQIPSNALLFEKGYQYGIWSIFILTSILVLCMPKNTPKYYCSFWIEAVPIFGFFIALIAEII